MHQPTEWRINPWVFDVVDQRHITYHCIISVCYSILPIFCLVLLYCFISFYFLMCYCCCCYFVFMYVVSWVKRRRTEQRRRKIIIIKCWWFTTNAKQRNRKCNHKHTIHNYSLVKRSITIRERVKKIENWNDEPNRVRIL